MEQLRIDPEFQNKIPPLSDTEFKQLEENILSAGEIYEPIVTWNGIIVDGHNRYKIAQSHPEIPYKTRQMDFADKWEAFDWMYKNQLGRRNLTDEQRAYLTGKMYEARKHCVGNPNARNEDGTFQLAEKRPIGRDGTSLIIAEELGIGKTAVKDNYKFAKGIDAIREEDPELAEDILQGKKNVTKGSVMAVAKADGTEKADAINAVRNYKRPSPSKKTQEERDADRELREKVSQSINEVVNGSTYEVTVDDLIELFQEAANTTVYSLKSIISSRKELVENNKTKVIESIDKIFTEMINEIKEII